MRYLIIFLCFLICGCQAWDFIACGDAGVCSEGRQYGCHGDDRCCKKKKEICDKEKKIWNEEYCFCEY